mmetsp:Transcript_26294/g.60744  ORF Transcript_26294/g.60744 Transcript_26294/m.60744 type:complete len:134 (+) Transcript_26294:99-500(+)
MRLAPSSVAVVLHPPLPERRLALVPVLRHARGLLTGGTSVRKAFPSKEGASTLSLGLLPCRTHLKALKHLSFSQNKLLLPNLPSSHVGEHTLLQSFSPRKRSLLLRLLLGEQSLCTCPDLVTNLQHGRSFGDC